MVSADRNSCPAMGLVGLARDGQPDDPLFLFGQPGGVLVVPAPAAARDSEFDGGRIGQPRCLAFLGDLQSLGQV
jgi:hypothetical protein